MRTVPDQILFEVKEIRQILDKKEIKVNQPMPRFLMPDIDIKNEKTDLEEFPFCFGFISGIMVSLMIFGIYKASTGLF